MRGICKRRALAPCDFSSYFVCIRCDQLFKKIRSTLKNETLTNNGPILDGKKYYVSRAHISCLLNSQKNVHKVNFFKFWIVEIKSRHFLMIFDYEIGWNTVNVRYFSKIIFGSQNVFVSFSLFTKAMGKKCAIFLDHTALSNQAYKKRLLEKPGRTG